MVKLQLRKGSGLHKVWRTQENTAQARHTAVDRWRGPLCIARFPGPPAVRSSQVPGSTQVMPARPRCPRVTPQAWPLLRAGHLQNEGHSHPRPGPGLLSSFFSSPSSQDHPLAQPLRRDCLPQSPSPVLHCGDRRQSTRSRRQGLAGNNQFTALQLQSLGQPSPPSLGYGGGGAPNCFIVFSPHQSSLSVRLSCSVSQVICLPLLLMFLSVCLSVFLIKMAGWSQGASPGMRWEWRWWTWGWSPLDAGSHSHRSRLSSRPGLGDGVATSATV